MNLHHSSFQTASLSTRPSTNFSLGPSQKPRFSPGFSFMFYLTPTPESEILFDVIRRKNFCSTISHSHQLEKVPSVNRFFFFFFFFSILLISSFFCPPKILQIPSSQMSSRSQEAARRPLKNAASAGASPAGAPPSPLCRACPPSCHRTLTRTSAKCICVSFSSSEFFRILSISPIWLIYWLPH